MDQNKIEIMFSDSTTISLTSDNPDIQLLVDTIVTNRNSINQDNIKILPSVGSNFDCENFKKMIIDLTKDFLAQLHIEDSNYDTSIKNSIKAK